MPRDKTTGARIEEFGADVPNDAAGLTLNATKFDSKGRVQGYAPAASSDINALIGTPAVGAKNGSTVTTTESGGGVWRKTVLTLTATPVTITDDAGVAQYGGAGKIYDFPEGLTVVLGAVVTGSLTLGTTGTIIDTYAGGVSLGTATATTGATLTGTEADIMPEVDVAAATAKVAAIDGVSVATALTESGARHFDGTATAKDMYLNFVVDDDATHTSGTGTFTGTVSFVWCVIGDN